MTTATKIIHRCGKESDPQMDKETGDDDSNENHSSGSDEPDPAPYRGNLELLGGKLACLNIEQMQLTKASSQHEISVREPWNLRRRSLRRNKRQP